MGGQDAGCKPPHGAQRAAEMQATGKVYQLETTLDRMASTGLPPEPEGGLPPEAETNRRIDALTLIHGDCRHELKNLSANSIDTIISDPIYPGISREYGSIAETEWLALMKDVVGQCRRVLKAKGSAGIHPPSPIMKKWVGCAPGCGNSCVGGTGLERRARLLLVVYQCDADPLDS